jgi:rfaE bifunctional protein nucleotidyltransferase chain/domain
LRFRSTEGTVPPPKILPRKELARISKQARAAGQILVLTNGCFDLLHAGHIRYLRQAGALGDVLAVGVNSDRSVRALKGRGRPIVCEADRAEIVAALEVVDYVTIFDEDTASELVAEVQPAVYTKGGDYSSNPSSDGFPVEGRAVLGYGGRVEIIGYVEGKSTTEILRRATEPVVEVNDRT